MAPDRSPQAIVPYLAYDDVPAAISFLCAAFGFEVSPQMPDGRISTPARLPRQRADARVLVPGARVRERISSTCTAVHRHNGTQLCARAPPGRRSRQANDAPHGDREYRAVDPEGQRWSFSTRVREMTPDEIRAAYGAK
jgi:uncharacterized glyoxalase superfamily protein PhnB